MLETTLSRARTFHFTYKFEFCEVIFKPCFHTYDNKKERRHKIAWASPWLRSVLNFGNDDKPKAVKSPIQHFQKDGRVSHKSHARTVQVKLDHTSQDPGIWTDDCKLPWASAGDSDQCLPSKRYQNKTIWLWLLGVVIFWREEKEKAIICTDVQRPIQKSDKEKGGNIHVI